MRGGWGFFLGRLSPREWVMERQIPRAVHDEVISSLRRRQTEKRKRTSIVSNVTLPMRWPRALRTRERVSIMYDWLSEDWRMKPPAASSNDVLKAVTSPPNRD